MKKLTWRFQKWLNYRCRPRRETKVRFGELTTQYGTQQVRLSGAVNLPANLCLDQNADETLSFFWVCAIVRFCTASEPSPTKGELLGRVGKLILPPCGVSLPEQ